MSTRDAPAALLRWLDLMVATAGLPTAELDDSIELLIEIRNARDPDPDKEPDDEDEEIENAPALLASMPREDRERFDRASYGTELDEREDDRADDEASEPGDLVAADLHRTGAANSYGEGWKLRAARRAVEDCIRFGTPSRQCHRGTS